MRGLGTIINALAIVIGGVLGILFKRFLKEHYQDTIIKATGFSVVFLGAAGTLSKILTVRVRERQICLKAGLKISVLLKSCGSAWRKTRLQSWKISLSMPPCRKGTGNVSERRQENFCAVAAAAVSAGRQTLFMPPCAGCAMMRPPTFNGYFLKAENRRRRKICARNWRR